MVTIAELERDCDLGGVQRRDVDALLADGSPQLDGNTATFFFSGPADSVLLQHWIHGLQQEQGFRRLPDTELWYLPLEIPPRSRIEYKLIVEQGGQARMVRDPLNPNVAQDPFGANSVVHGAGYAEPEWTRPSAVTRPGELHEARLVSQAFGGPRTFQVYLPPRYREARRYPLLIVHDGQDFCRFAALQTVLDNLIDRDEIAPLIVVLTSAEDRLVEYAADPRHARFVVDELLPWVSQRFPLVDSPSARGLMGSSFGAIAALSTAWRNPGVFGNLSLSSGSFLFTDIGDHEGGPPFDPVVAFMNEFRRAPGRPSDKLYQTCGTFEPMIYYNRSMVPAFQATGMELRFDEAPDGHNWINWRDRLRDGLSWLFPGPLWMVYE